MSSSASSSSQYDSDDERPGLEPAVDLPEPAPKTWTQLKDEGNLVFLEGKYDECIALYTQAIALKDDEPVLFSNRAMSYIKQRQHTKAARDASKCIELDSNFVKAYGRLAHAQTSLGDFREAVTTLDKGVAKCREANNKLNERELLEQLAESRAIDASVTKARDLIAADKNVEALRVIAPVAMKKPDSLPLALLMAEARAPSDPVQALFALNPFGATESNNPDYIYTRALATYYSGQNGLKNAALLAKGALELDPEHARSKILWKKARAVENQRVAANEAFSQKKWELAIEQYTKLIDNDPKNKQFIKVVLGNRAAARMELRQYPLALSDVSSAIENGNDAPKIYARRSRIYVQLDKFDDALRDMSKAAEMDNAYESEVSEIKKQKKLAGRKDWYKVLAVTKAATPSEIKRAYRMKALEWHPDKWANSSDAEKLEAEKRFKECGEANAMLSDPQKKAMYDNGQIDNETDHASGGRQEDHGGMGGGMDFSQFFGGGGGGMGGGGGRRSRGGAPPGFSFGFQ